MKNIKKKHYLVLSRPSRIRLEASNVCQLRCPLCQNTFGKLSKRGYLKLYDFKLLMEKNPFLKEVELSNWGEVFLNPDLMGIMEYAYEHGIHLYCDNGANLNTVSEEVLACIAKYRLRSIFCSIDGASQETYEQYRIGGDFSTVIANIEKINFYKKLYRSEFPILTWQFIVFPHNKHEIAQAHKMASRLGMGFYTKLPCGANHTPAGSGGKSSVGETGVGLQPEKQRAQETLRLGLGRHICAQLWTGPQINYDGEMLGCCVAKKAWEAGNVFTSGLLPVVNGEKMKLAREMVLGQSEEREDIVCSHCKRFKHMKEHDDWLTMREVNFLRLLSRTRRFLFCGYWYYITLHKAALWLIARRLIR